MKRTDNHGSLSRNKKKEKSTQPDHRGSATILGVKFWISAYINESTDEGGGKYFKLYFDRKQADSSEPPAEPAPEDLSSQPDIPF